MFFGASIRINLYMSPEKGFSLVENFLENVQFILESEIVHESIPGG